MNLTAVDLFSGIGGMALGARLAGIEVALLCEIEPYQRSVLTKNFPGVPIVEDVHGVNPIEVQAAVSRAGGDGLTVVQGSFPIQANDSRGHIPEGSPRDLWDEFVRVVYECQPAWAVVETFPRLSQMGLDDALWDLDRAGYDTQAFVLPAQAVDCPARSDRLWIVGARRGSTRSLSGLGDEGHDRGRDRWPVPGPELCRVAERFPEGLDTHTVRLHAIGDATVPQVASLVLGGIAEIENSWAGRGIGS